MGLGLDISPRTGVARVGYNTSNIPTKVNGKHTTEWQRGGEVTGEGVTVVFFSKNALNTLGCYVCERWHNFMNFYNDIIRMKGYEHISTKRWFNLDKDIIVKGQQGLFP